MTQVERLTRYLLSHPGASSMEIIEALNLTNATGRLSDLRAHPPEGFTLVKEKRDDGWDGYRLVQLHPVQLRLDVA